MHETAIALAVVREVQRLIRESKNRPSLVEVVLGGLQNLDLETLSTYLRLYLEEEGLGSIKYRFKVEEPVLRCGQCGHTWRLRLEELSPEVREAIHFLPEAIHVYVKCPKCGSHDLELVSGREIRVRLYD